MNSNSMTKCCLAVSSIVLAAAFAGAILSGAGLAPTSRTLPPIDVTEGEVPAALSAATVSSALMPILTDLPGLRGMTVVMS